MHFRHLASEEYDLFDPLNHVQEGVKKKKNNQNVAPWIGFQKKNSHVVIQVNVTGAREGGLSTGWRAQEKKKNGRYFYFDSITQTYVPLIPGYLSVLCVTAV